MTDTKRPRRLKPFDAVPFTNSKGHVLQPGDAAIAVTTCTSRGELRVGTYLGTRKGSYGVNVILEVKDSRTVLVDANDVPYDWNAEYRELPYPRGYPRFNANGARYGTPEYIKANEEYQAAVKEYNAGPVAEYKAAQAKRREGYANKEFPYTWVTNLQNNNIYPAGIALVDVTL